MRESTRPHGFMKTGSGKLASLRSIHPQYRVGAKSCDGGDDSHVRAMWDEEFFGHDLPPNYIISREGSVDEHHSKRKDSGSSRRDFTELSPREQAMWDEEFLGHELPSNYRISRDKTSEGLTRRKESDSSSRRGPKKSNSGEKTGTRGGSHRHARFISEDTFEYHFDRTVDTYVLCDKKAASCKENGSSNLDNGGGGRRDGSVRSKDESCTKEETFEERALRFGVEDWNLVGKKWSHSESKSSRRSSRRGIFHSPSGSDTSSLVSTLESSSFSCGSEGSSFAKGDYSASGYCQSNGYSMSSVRIPLSSLARPSADGNAGDEKVTDDGQFVELTLLNRSKSDASDSKPHESLPGEQENGNFLEFNFLDGRMVESPDDDDIEAGESHGQREKKFSIRLKDEDVDSEEFAERNAATPTVYQSATTQSPESESFFGSSHDSDWSGTHSVSTERGDPTSVHDGGDHGDVDVDASVYTEDRTEDWSRETEFFDANSASVSKKASSSKEHIQLYPEDRMASVNRTKQHRDLLRSLGKSSDLDKKSLKTTLSQGTSRRARSLGSVLSQHLAFTAIPSLRHKAQLGRSSDKKPPHGSPWDGDSPAKVSAACIEWLWAEKGHMKPVQSLRSIAAKERELAAARENLAKAAGNPGTAAGDVAPGPPVRNLEAAFKESKASSAVLCKAQSNVEKGGGADITRAPRRSGASPVRVAWRDPSKESRASILASWAAVYGLAESSSEKIRSHPKSVKVGLLSTSSKKVRSGTPVKRTSGSSAGGASGSPRPSAKAGSRLSRHVPKNLALELEVLCRPFGPVLKGVRCLPTAKRGPARPPFFSSHSGDFQAPEVPSASTSSQVITSTLLCGRLQCVVTRDGLPSYSLIMDESEEIFVAKTQRVDSGLQEGVTHLYTFHSYKGKGKGKITHWRQWGKKEKPSSDFAGNMKVTSTISPLMSCNGVQNFVESEFVLLDAKVKEISISVPTSSSYPRSSFSSWDATPMRSPRLPSSSFSSPSSTYFSLPSPAGAAFSTLEGGLGSLPALTLPSSRYVSQSMPAAVGSRPSGSSLDKSSSSLDKGVLRLRQLERHVTLSSPLQYNPKMAGNYGYSESWSDTETLDDTESRITRFLPQTQSELAAVVVRAPMCREQDKAASGGDKWGWGINFLSKGGTPEKPKAGGGTSPSASATECQSSKDCAVVRGSSEDGSTTLGEAAIPSGESCASTRDQVCGSCGSMPVNDRCKGGMSVTLILPAGNHGCSANGLDGPQPLVERWKSGGKCDCGSWDLGCGLTVLGNQKMEPTDNSTLASADGTEPQDNSLRLFVQGKKQETMGLTLTALREGCYTLGFQAPISPLHAFATAVAVLHSRDPLNTTKTVGDAKRRGACRAPVKGASSTSTSTTTTTSTMRSISTRPCDETFCVKPLVSYQLVCPDPPLSPFGRA